MILVVVATLLITGLIGVGALAMEHGLARRSGRSRRVWLIAMLCSIAASLLPILHTYSRALEHVGGATSERTFALRPGLLWLLSCVDIHAMPTVFVCWGLMSITLLQVVAYDLIRPYAILHKLDTLNVGSTLIYVSERSGPLTFGLFNPKIVVPRYFLELDSRVQELILAHERQHVEGRDWLLRVFGFLTIGLIPWNPVLYWQLARLTRAIELDCDARVLGKLAYGDRMDYARCLLRVSDRLFPSCNARSLLTYRIGIMCARDGSDEVVADDGATAAKYSAASAEADAVPQWDEP